MNTSVKRIVVCDVGEFLKVPMRLLYPIKKRRDLKKQSHWPLVIPREPGIHRFTDIAPTPAGPGGGARPKTPHRPGPPQPRGAPRPPQGGGAAEPQPYPPSNPGRRAVF